MRPLVITIASLSMLASAPSFAQAEGQASEATAAESTEAVAADETGAKQVEKEDPGSKVKCKYQHVVGSRIPQKVCFTVDEWEEIRLRILEEARGAKNNNSYCRESGPC